MTALRQAGLLVACLLAWLPCLATDYYKAPAPAGTFAVSPTHYDYSDAAKELTQGCKTNIDKLRHIYEWICHTIAYDTSHQIFTADECFDTGRGVCQAYCELFWQLATAAGLRVEIVSGESRDYDGILGDVGHAWLFAYTRDNHGILIDPTWGAGSVDNGQFVRRKDIWRWFNPDPEWMILTHLPEKEQYQLIDQKMTMQEFVALPPVKELWLTYGMNAHHIYQQARAHRLALPRFYNGGEGEFEVVDVPQRSSLRIGQSYTFRVRVKSARPLALINNRDYAKDEQWHQEGQGVYSITYMPRDEQSLCISLKNPTSNYWNTMLKYDVEPPTAADWARVEKQFPLSLPEARRVKNLDAERWARAGIDGHRLLTLIRQQHIEELPTLFDDKGQRLAIDQVPMTQCLKAGTPCVFRFRPQSGIHWALVNNDDWHTSWQVSTDGLHAMTITPAPGKLQLYVQLQEGQPYWSCLDYDVE